MLNHLGLFGKRGRFQKSLRTSFKERRLRPTVEGLEDRTLLSISFSGPNNSGLCTITGTPAENQSIIQLKAGDPTTIEFSQSGVLGLVSVLVDAALSGITGVDVLAAPGIAKLTINENNGLIGKSTPLPIRFAGGPGLDTLLLEGTATGPVTETFTQGPGQGGGVLDITNGMLSSTISLTGVGRINDTMTGATLTINTSANAANNFVMVHNGASVDGFQTDTVDLRNITLVSANMDDEDLGNLNSVTNLADAADSFPFGTFESVSFANKTNLAINGNGRDNFFLVAVTQPAAGFHSLTLDGVSGFNAAAIVFLPPSVSLSLINIQVQAKDNDSAFIEEMYEERLGRLASQAELAAWLKVFQTSGQSAVATGIEQSLEARTDLVEEFYLRYLGRAALNGEEQGWVQLLMKGETEEQVIAGILSSSEFYTRTQTLISSGTPDQRYVQALYQLLLNRSASAGEVASWVSKLQVVGRFGVALGILESVEFRAAAITVYYVEFLQRLPDVQGLAGWLGSSLSLEQIRLGFESSGELLANA
jgi:Domain of unknown function (DUF4214)